MVATEVHALPSVQTITAEPNSVEIDFASWTCSPLWLGSKKTGADESASQPAAEPADSSARRYPSAYNGYVLAVDDDYAIREALHDLLIDEGYSVVEAKDGDEALAYLRTTQERYVVLLDYIMPRVNGLEVLRAVAADALLASKYAFILISANIMVPTGELAILLAQLKIPLLQKPFQLPTLLQAIEQAAHRIEPE